MLSIGEGKLLLLLRSFPTHLKHKIPEAAWLDGLVVGGSNCFIQSTEGHGKDDFN